MSRLLPRVVSLIGALVLLTLAYAWLAIAYFAADTTEGAFCGGTLAADAQLVLGYCGAGCLIWLAAAVARMDFRRGGSSWRVAAPLGAGLAITWFLVASVPCALTG